MADNDNYMTFSGHLEVLRKMFIRIFFTVVITTLLVFVFKDVTFDIILAPSDSDFWTYKALEQIIHKIGINFYFSPYSVDLITTELSSQFMTHLSTSLYLGVLMISPYILYEIFRFVTPALYEDEKKLSSIIFVSMYFMFLLGVIINYYVIFPFSFRFLGTYQVSPKVHSTITLDSYMDTYLVLSLVMGLIFQLPIVSYLMAKYKLVSYSILSEYRKHTFIIILLVAAIITPPDLMTLFLVTIPLYCLFEISLWIVRVFNKSSYSN